LVTDAVLEAPGPSIVYANPAFTRMTGWSLGEVLGRSPRFLQGPGTDWAVLRGMTATLRQGRTAEAQVMNYRRTGLPYWVDMKVAPLRDQAGCITHFVAIERDATRDALRPDTPEPLAERDPTTGLANRQGFGQQIARLSVRPGLPLCLVAIGLDDLPQLRGRLGWAAADALLLGVADTLAENLRRADVIGRIEDDIFLVGMPGILPAEALAVAGRLQRSIRATPFATPAGPLQAGCCIGVAAMPAVETGLAALIDRAKAALQQARSASGGLLLDRAAPGPVALQPATPG
jgi:diguanylate cyclase (GGDEF)-like protein/PAS domain S-box-containing protein